MENHITTFLLKSCIYMKIRFENFHKYLNISRYAHECDPPEWKERGTGDIRILKHIEKNTCRIVMR